MAIGTKLKELRKQNKMTLEDVAVHINVGRATVLKYENGMITNIPSDKIEQLSRLFNVSPSYLMGWDEPAQPSSYTPITSEARLLARGADHLPPEERKRLIEMANLMFDEVFGQEDDDAT